MPPPGDQEIRLEFITPFENRAGRIVTLATILLILTMALFRRKWEPFL